LAAVFGSARSLTQDPEYGVARGVARAVARAGFKVLNGDGSGLMEAAS